MNERLTRLLYMGDDVLIHAPRLKSRNFFILQAVFTTLVGMVVGGSFLNGFALSLGIPESFVGFLTMLPSIAGITLMASPAILRKVKSQKWFTVYGMGVTRLLQCACCLLPFLPKNTHGVLLITLQALAYVVFCYSVAMLNPWYMSLVPMPIRGRYTALRSSYCMVINIAAPALAGMLMDGFANKQTGYMVLCGIGFLAAVVEFIGYANIEDTPAEELPKTEMPSIRESVKTVVTDKPFRGFTMSLFLFYVFFYISASMIQIYYIKYMELSYTFINVLVVIGAVVQIFGLKLWGRFCDTMGPSFVVQLAVWFYALEYLVWIFSGKGNIYFTSILAMVFSSAAASSFNIGVFNRRYELIPGDKKVMYESFYGFFIGISLLCSFFFGAGIRGFIAERPMLYQNMKNGQIKLLFIITFTGLFCYQLVISLRTRWFGSLKALLQKKRRRIRKF